MAPPKRPQVPLSFSCRPFVSAACPTVLAILLLVTVTYWSSLSNRFVWQDALTVSGGASDGRWIAPRPRGNSALIRYLFSIEYQVWGLAPRGYHLVSLAAHAVSALLIWRLLSLMAVPGARLAALIFAVHPVCVESVAWTSATANVVSLALCLASLLAFWQSALVVKGKVASPLFHRIGVRYGMALVFYVAALFSSPASVALPAVLIVMQWWHSGRLTRSHWSRIAPFAALTLLAIGMGATHQPTDDQPLESLGESLPSLAIVTGRSIWFYASNLVWPVRLLFVYPSHEIDPSLWRQYVPLAAALSLVAALWWLQAQMGRGPAAAALIFISLVVTQVVLGSAVGLTDNFLADYHQYQASIALIALFAALLVLAIRRLALDKTAVLGLVSLAVLVPLCLLAERRTHVFYDCETLDQATLTGNPAAWIAHHDRAILFQQQGRLAEAIAVERSAVEILDNCRHISSSQFVCADDLAGCREHLAVLLELSGNSADAAIERDKSLAIREELVRQQPDELAYRDHLAWSYVDRAVAARRRGNAVDALEWYRKAVEQQQLVAAADTARFTTQANLAANDVDIGLLELDEGHAEEARTAFTRARDLREHLVERFPREPRYLDGLAWCYSNLALVETWLVHRESALNLSSQAVALREQLVREFPAVAEYREQLAILYSDVGLKQRQLENLHEAERAFSQALKLRQRLADEDPRVAEYQDHLAANHVDLGSVQRTLGDLPAAEKSYREAIQIRAQLARAQPALSTFRQRLAGTYVELGILEREAGRADASSLLCQQAIEICRQLVHEAPQELANQVALSWAYENLGLAQLAAAQTAQAVASCATALRLSEQLVQQSGGELAHRVDLGRAYFNLGMAQFAHGDSTEAEANHRRALDVRAQLIQDGPAIDLYKHNAAQSCSAIAEVMRATGRRGGAAALYQAAIDIHEALVTQNQSTVYESALRDDLIAFADVSAERGDWPASVAAYTKACQHGARTMESLAYLALLQWAVGDEASYHNTCVQLLSRCDDSVSVMSAFPVTLALVVGKHGTEHAETLLRVAQLAARPLSPSRALILVGAAEYRAGMVNEAIAKLTEALRSFENDEELVLRLIGTMLLADAYRDQQNAAALPEVLIRLDDLIFETIVSGESSPGDRLPAWLVRLAVEVSRRELDSLRSLPADVSAPPASQ